jgi:cytochrome c oxidase subunit IV
VVLTILTAIEIAAYYVEDQLGGIAAPLILVLSAAKFILVVMFYMHLKYDSRAFTGIFSSPSRSVCW